MQSVTGTFEMCVFLIAELSDPFNEPLFEKVLRSVKDLKSSVTAIRKTLQNKTAGGTGGKNSNRFSPGAPTRKRPKVEMSLWGEASPEAGRSGSYARVCHRCREVWWVGGQTRCLVSVLTKRAINSMKTGQFILNSQIYAQRVPPRIHRCAGI